MCHSPPRADPCTRRGGRSSPFCPCGLGSRLRARTQGHGLSARSEAERAEYRLRRRARHNGCCVSHHNVHAGRHPRPRLLRLCASAPVLKRAPRPGGPRRPVYSKTLDRRHRVLCEAQWAVRWLAHQRYADARRAGGALGTIGSAAARLKIDAWRIGPLDERTRRLPAGARHSCVGCEEALSRDLSGWWRQGAPAGPLVNVPWLSIGPQSQGQKRGRGCLRVRQKKFCRETVGVERNVSCAAFTTPRRRPVQRSSPAMTILCRNFSPFSQSENSWISWGLPSFEKSPATTSTSPSGRSPRSCQKERRRCHTHPARINRLDSLAFGKGVSYLLFPAHAHRVFAVRVADAHKSKFRVRRHRSCRTLSAGRHKKES